VILVLSELYRTRVEATTVPLCLKPNKFGASLLSLLGYATNVNVLALHLLHFIKKSSIFMTVMTYKKRKRKHEQYCAIIIVFRPWQYGLYYERTSGRASLSCILYHYDIL